MTMNDASSLFIKYRFSESAKVVKKDVGLIWDRDQKLRNLLLICPVRDKRLVEKTIYLLIKCRQVRHSQYIMV
jgi:hypothetical protein